MTTSTKVKFGFYAMSVKNDGTPTADCQPFTHVLDLKKENIQKDLYSTYEGNYWLLDGNFKFVPSDTSKIKLGLISTEMSGADGVFAVAPTLTIECSQDFLTNGLTLKFAPASQDWASEISVQFYNADNNLMMSTNYNPSGYEFLTLQEVSGFRKIVIQFLATNNPYRYVRLSGIDYGTLITFEDADIKSASSVEQIHPVSIELPVGELELSLFSNNTSFDITDPTGDYFDLQNRQALDVYETVNGADEYIGRYYLNEWENKSDNEIVFKASDILGVLDAFTFYGGIYSGVSVMTVLSALLDSKDVLWEIDSELEAATLTGWIPVCTFRAALQQIAFAIGGYVSAVRSNVLSIRKTVITHTAYDATITKAQKGSQQSLALKPLVTGVELLSHDYSENTDAIELYNGTLAIGTYTIKFNQPAHDLSISGASITSSDANYAVIAVIWPGAVILSGLKYTDAQQIHGVYNSGLDVNVPINVLSLTSTLVSSAIAPTVAQRVYDYYQQRYSQKTKLFAPSAQAGDAVLIDTLKNRQISGTIEKMSLNLSGGFTVQTEITGVIV